MCGLSGVAGYVTDSEKKAMVDLLTMNIVRGIDSTGIAGIHRDDSKDFSVVRALGTPYGDGIESHGLFNLMSFERLLKQPMRALIGHNRAATKGSVTVRNAHPFKFSNIVGAHNGTLHYSCMKKLKEINQGIEYDTDSESLFAAINLVGAREVIPVLEGAWALVWFDKRDQTLNFLRNSERTLHYIFDESEKVLAWSSDFSPLIYACNRQKISIGTKKAKLFPENQWFKFVLPKVAEKFADPVQEELKGFEYIYKSNRSFWQDNNHSAHEGYWSNGRFIRYDGKPTYSDADWSEYLDQGDDDSYGIKGDTCGVERINSTTFSVDRSEANEPEKKATVHLLPPKDPVAEAKRIIGTLNQDPPWDAKEKRTSLIEGVKEKSNIRFMNTFSVFVQTFRLKYQNHLNRVYYDSTNEMWHHFKYAVSTDIWTHDELPHPPACIPLKMVNIEAGGCHSFTFKGKREKRIAMYKGFRRELLVKETFEKIMSHGCINCQRRPSWGNLVRFFSPVDFLCEHCCEMPRVVKMVGELDDISRKAS